MVQCFNWMLPQEHRMRQSVQKTLTSLDFVAWTTMLMCDHPERDVQPLAYKAHPNVCIATPTSGHV